MKYLMLMTCLVLGNIGVASADCDRDNEIQCDSITDNYTCQLSYQMGQKQNGRKVRVPCVWKGTFNQGSCVMSTHHTCPLN